MSEELTPDASSLFQDSLPVHPDVLTSDLRTLKIQFEQFDHPPLKTVEVSKAYRDGMLTKHEGGGHIKNLYLRDHKKNNFLAVIQEDQKVDLKELADLIQSGRLSFGSADRLLENLGVRPGAVTPLSMITGVHKGVKLAIDGDLFQMAKIYMHPLVNDRTISIVPEEMNKYLEYLGVQPIKLNFANE
jgi:Ala-tRNA(Pro) deacylase